MLIVTVLLAQLAKMRPTLNEKCWFDKKKQNIVKHKNLSSRIKIGKEILIFGNIKIEKNKFYLNKTPIFLNDVDIEKVLVSNKISLGEKITNTLLVTSIMTTKLIHKPALM